ncbi:MAG TPA: NIPSNAP family protein [Ohtaekwangia sp.]|nr:NIPSNAP family protein [Ohtaekwangia sp.]
MKTKATKLSLLILLLLSIVTMGSSQDQTFYEIKIYHFKTDEQERRIDQYLEKAFIPALHRLGLKQIGVFKPIEPDTIDRKIYVLIPHKSLTEISALQTKLAKDNAYLTAGADYINAAYTAPPFNRLESIILKAFSHHPALQLPKLKGLRNERVYELRSYEGHTEKIFQNKVKMFNEGGEVALFERLQFNAIFYGEVLVGSHMPNLMYMTSFENKAERDAHWKSFGADPEWKKLSSMPEYQNNVSKNTITFLRPTDYSDY